MRGAARGASYAVISGRARGLGAAWVAERGVVAGTAQVDGVVAADVIQLDNRATEPQLL